MAVRHINPYAKEESGIFVSDEDAKQVFSMIFDEKSEEEIRRKRERFNAHIEASIKNAKGSSR